MKKKVLTLALVLMTGIIFSLSAQADPLVHVTNPKGGSFSGGPFYIVEQTLVYFLHRDGRTLCAWSRILLLR